jgi:FKBP-type peptidyl-prolyl cis-trans isomerase FkpA
MKRLTLVAVGSLTLFAPAACRAVTQGAGSGAPVELKSEDDKTLYALGLIIGRNLGSFTLKPEELEVVKKGMEDAALKHKPAVELETYGPKVQELGRTRQLAAAQTEKENGKTFVETAAKEQGAERTASGLVFKSLSAGQGASPNADSTVKVHYTGTLTDGTVFDSSVKRGTPAEFPLKGVIPCWTEGVQKMKVGGKAKLVCPSDIAYGDQGRPPTIPGGATLVFEVELLEVKGAAPTPAAPVK